MANRIVKNVFRGDISDARASLKALSSVTRETAKSITDASDEAQNFRQGLSAVCDSALKMGLVASAGVALVTKAAMDWESAWTGVLKTVDGTPQQLSAIESGLRDMTGVLPATHQELAAIAEAAGALGVETDSILEFTRVAADLGESTNLSSEQAATGLAQLMNVLRTSPGDVDRLGSTLVALGNNGASTEAQILDMAQGIAGAGSIVGASEADILALSNALASVGIEAEAGGSSVSAILQDMATAAKSGGADLDLFAKTAGLSAEQFAKAFEERPIEAFNQFTQGLGRINEEGGNVFGVLKDLGQSDVRVSRALLTMAQSGDLLTDSLATGAAEWERNTALADEAGKRYDTSAAKATMAWNNIKDAAIDAGQGMLPVVESLASGVGKVTDAFSALPSGVKGSVGVVGAVGAAGLIAVGGITKMVSAASNARDALDKLGEIAPRTAGAVGKVGKAFGIVGAAIVAADLSADLFNAEDVAGVERFAAALLDLGDGGGSASAAIEKLASRKAGSFLGATITGDIESLSDAIDTLDASKWERFLNSGFGESRIDLARDVIQQTDAALTSLVQSGATDEAAAAFEYFAAEAAKGGVSLDKARAMLPGYADALAGVSNDQEIAANSASAMADATQDAASKMGMSVEQYEAVQKAATDTASSFIGLGESLNDSKVSLGDWLAELEKQNDALADFTNNAIEAAHNGLDEGLIASLREAGPEGALRLAELADASESEIERANAAFRDGQAEISRYADAASNIPQAAITEFSTPGADNAIDKAVEVAQKYNLTPDQVETIMKALDFASDDIRTVKDRLGNLDGDKATVQIRADIGSAIASLNSFLSRIPLVRRVRIVSDSDYGDSRRSPGAANGGAIPILRATGGSVIGAGTGTSDSISAIGPGATPYRLSNGEHVLTAQEVDLLGGQQAVYAMRAAIRAKQFTMAYAGGGSVGSKPSSPTSLDPRAFSREFERAMTSALTNARFRVDRDGSMRLTLMGA